MVSILIKLLISLLLEKASVFGGLFFILNTQQMNFQELFPLSATIFYCSKAVQTSNSRGNKRITAAIGARALSISMFINSKNHYRPA